MAVDTTRLRKVGMASDTICAEGRELLEKYAGIPANKVEELVLSVVRYQIGYIFISNILAIQN
jgi:hypothetical protein